MFSFKILPILSIFIIANHLKKQSWSFYLQNALAKKILYTYVFFRTSITIFQITHYSGVIQMRYLDKINYLA